MKNALQLFQRVLQLFLKLKLTQKEVTEKQLSCCTTTVQTTRNDYLYVFYYNKTNTKYELLINMKAFLEASINFRQLLNLTHEWHYFEVTIGK